jgi:hypothetical protein
VATTHALRAAFAVQFDEEHPDRPIALKELMGHARIKTHSSISAARTRRGDGNGSIAAVSCFPPSEGAAYRKAPKYRGFLEEAHTGFEPVLPP